MKKISSILLPVFAAALTVLSCAPAQTITKSGLDPKNFEAEFDGAATALYTLTNANGMEVCITNFGGRIVSIMVPDKNGEMKDVVLGFDNIQDYKNIPSDFGAAIGRYANRIANAKFTLDGKEYTLPANNNGHCLHGGPNGWQYAIFTAAESSASSLKLTYESPDGDAGFPGKVNVSVTYTLTADNRINIDYEAVTDAPTVINMTNHSYFNLSGDPNNKIVNDFLYINASQCTPADELLIPTGEITSVDGTPLDFRKAKPIAPDIDTPDNDQIAYGRGYDHNWILDTGGNINNLAAEVYCHSTGIILDVYTDEPGIQIYTGNFLDGTVTGKHGIVYNHRTAICLESQHYPDSPNKPEFPSTVLRPGEKYSSHTVFAFNTIK